MEWGVSPNGRPWNRAAGSLGGGQWQTIVKEFSSFSLWEGANRPGLPDLIRECVNVYELQGRQTSQDNPAAKNPHTVPSRGWDPSMGWGKKAP